MNDILYFYYIIEIAPFPSCISTKYFLPLYISLKVIPFHFSGRFGLHTRCPFSSLIPAKPLTAAIHAPPALAGAVPPIYIKPAHSLPPFTKSAFADCINIGYAISGLSV